MAQALNMAPPVHYLRPAQNLARVGTVRAGIHDDGTADGAWYADHELHPRKPPGGSLLGDCRVESGRTCNHIITLTHHLCKRAPKTDGPAP